MARYIDADKLIAHLNDEIEGCKPPFSGRANGKSIAYGTALGLKSAISFAETLSTADVAPKSEVAREIFEEIENTLNQRIKLYYTITVSTVDSIDRIKATASESALRAVRDYVAELKKKYAEGE